VFQIIIFFFYVGHLLRFKMETIDKIYVKKVAF